MPSYHVAVNLKSLPEKDHYFVYEAESMSDAVQRVEHLYDNPDACHFGVREAKSIEGDVEVYLMSS